MNLTNFAIAFFILISSTLSITTSSIAIECYRQNPKMQEEKRGNWIFTIVNLVFSVIFALLAMRSMYRSFSEVDFQQG